MLNKIIISTFAAISVILAPVIFSAQNSDAAAQHKQGENLKSYHRSQDAAEHKEVGSEREIKPKRMQHHSQIQPKQMMRGSETTGENADEASKHERKFRSRN